MMDKDHAYDTLAALGVRIATRLEQDFLKANIRHIEAEHGTALAADLVRALSLNDGHAAARVAEALCYGGDFVLASESNPVRVEWSFGNITGSTDMPAGTPAQAIVIAAINANHAARNQPSSPRA